MKFRIFGLVAIAAFAVALIGSAAYAQRVTFNYTGSLVTWTVPTTALYQITAYGAQGGTNSGGRGAEIGGDLSLTAGEIIQIAVGGAGQGTESANQS